MYEVWMFRGRTKKRLATGLRIGAAVATRGATPGSFLVFVPAT